MRDQKRNKLRRGRRHSLIIAENSGTRRSGANPIIHAVHLRTKQWDYPLVCLQTGVNITIAVARKPRCAAMCFAIPFEVRTEELNAVCVAIKLGAVQRADVT